VGRFFSAKVDGLAAPEGLEMSLIQEPVRLRRSVRLGLVGALAVAAAAVSAPTLAEDAGGGAANAIWSRERLVGTPNAVRDAGLDIRADMTQFMSGLAGGGEGNRTWTYGGKLDFYLNADGGKAVGWDGLSLTAHLERAYGRDQNGAGGTLIPLNTALAFPGTDALDVSLWLTQKIANVVTIRAGKVNVVDLAKATPLKGGGGDTFMNTALAAPITGLLPPVALGTFVNVDTRPVAFSFAVYDPASAMGRTGFEAPFRDGVSARATATLAVEPFGRSGWYGVKALASTTSGLDLRTVPDLLLPRRAGTGPRFRSGPYFVGISAQQYLVQDATDRRRGWGVFGEFGVSDGNPTPQSGAGYIGVGGTSPLPGRETDRWGVAGFRNVVSDDLVRALEPVLRLGAEQGVEAYYTFAVTPWLGLTADLQAVRPALRDQPNVVLGTVRTTMKF
jgi:porin